MSDRSSDPMRNDINPMTITVHNVNLLVPNPNDDGAACLEPDLSSSLPLVEVLPTPLVSTSPADDAAFPDCPPPCECDVDPEPEAKRRSGFGYPFRNPSNIPLPDPIVGDAVLGVPGHCGGG